ncbi:MAG: aminoglycoside phosphotransferase family protein [Clostridia bacterium]|nr:aminoglycoside phosphotransferase family protein [Clostridia bacterium]
MDAQVIASQFTIQSPVVSAKPMGIGNINASFVVTCEDGSKYALQRINTNIFKDPKGMMNNIFAVTEHIRNKVASEGGDPDREVLQYLKTAEGETVYETEEGVYRMYRFVDDVLTIQQVPDAEWAYQCAFAFGRFQKQLSDFDSSVLIETIPNFHHTQKRYETFLASVEKDATGRKEEVADLIEFAKKESYLASAIVKDVEAGVLPVRVTHNDTKINNILFNPETKRGMCIIDLDTVMPATTLYDFGDMVRTAATVTEEDDERYDQVGMDLRYFKALVKGYYEGSDGALTREEIKRFPLSAKVITYETFLRFLTDYLDGDVYFACRKDRHNLIRATNQMYLLRNMEDHYEQMLSVLDEL